MAEYGNTGGEVDLGIPSRFPANLGPDVDTALDTALDPPPQEAAPAPVDESEKVEWETPSRPFGWASVFAGAALGGLGTITKNKSILPQFLKDQQVAAVKYEERMGRLQEIQASAGSNSSMLKHLEMIGGGDPNKGARIMSKQSPEALQKTLAKWEGSSTALQFAENLNAQNPGLISDQALANFKRMGKDLTMAHVTTPIEIGWKQRAEQDRAEALKYTKDQDKLKSAQALFQSLVPDLGMEEAIKEVQNQTGLNPFGPNIHGSTGANTGDSGDDTPKKQELAATEQVFQTRVSGEAEVRERQGDNAAVATVNKNTNKPADMYAAYMQGMTRLDGTPEPSRTRGAQLLEAVKGTPAHINQKAQVGMIASLYERIKTYAEPDGLVGPTALAAAREGDTTIAAEWDMLSPGMQEFIMEYGQQIAQDGFGGAGEVGFIEGMAGNQSLYTATGEDANSVHSVFGSLSAEQMAQNKQRGMQWVEGKAKLRVQTQASRIALGLDWDTADSDRYNIDAMTEQETLEALKGGTYGEGVMDTLVDEFKRKHAGRDGVMGYEGTTDVVLPFGNIAHLKLGVKTLAPREFMAARDAMESRDFKGQTQQFKDAFMSKMFPMSSITDTAHASNALLGHDNHVQRNRAKMKSDAGELNRLTPQTGFDVALIHDSSDFLENNTSQWSNKVVGDMALVLAPESKLLDMTNPAHVQVYEALLPYTAILDQDFLDPTRTKSVYNEFDSLGERDNAWRREPGMVAGEQDPSARYAHHRGLFSSFEQTPVAMLKMMREMANVTVEVDGKQVNALHQLKMITKGSASDAVAALQLSFSGAEKRALQHPDFVNADLDDPTVFDQTTGRVTLNPPSERSPQEHSVEYSKELGEFASNVNNLYAVGSSHSYGESPIASLTAHRDAAQAKLDILMMVQPDHPAASRIQQQITRLDSYLGNDGTIGSIATADRELDLLADVASKQGSKGLFPGVSSAQRSKPITHADNDVWGVKETGLMWDASATNKKDLAGVGAGAETVNSLQQYSEALSIGYKTPDSIAEELRGLLSAEGALVAIARASGHSEAEARELADKYGKSARSGGQLAAFLDHSDTIHVANMNKSLDQLISDYQEVAGTLPAAEIKRIKDKENSEDDIQKYKYRLSYQSIAIKIQKELKAE